jgi:DNA-binding CsgD family transcriptional regulator
MAGSIFEEYPVHSIRAVCLRWNGVEQVIRKMRLPELICLPQEEACATEVVKATLQRALVETVQEALVWGTARLGFDSFAFGIVANDRRPDAESRAYILTNQDDKWVRAYDEHDYLDVDPRVDLAGEPGYAFWEAREFDKNPRHTVFLTEAASYGIQSGLVVGLCTRDPPCYAMMGFNCAAPTLDHWDPEQRALIAGQATILGKVLSRSMRKFLYEEELLFPAPSMKLNPRERAILTLAAAGKTSKEIGVLLGIAKVTVDILVGGILSKMGALNRNQAIAKAIGSKLIQVPDDVYAEYKSAKLQATRRERDARRTGYPDRNGDRERSHAIKSRQGSRH